jgi:hypothetical protein
MDNLLSHPGFRLIHVDDGHMSLITPLDHIEDVRKNGYRCISHLWGNATRWEDHGIKNVTWGVDVREEKRAKLLQIFDHFKGYWWVDVFCTDQDSDNKPLSIMGDVYRYCKECICLLDIEIPAFINQPSELWPKDSAIIFDKHVVEILECEWNKRVWTFQECLLPPEICYTSETVGDNFCVVNKDMFIYAEDAAKYTTWVGIVHPYRAGILRNHVRHMFEKGTSMPNAIRQLIRSGRKCKNREDYYYGIAGVFGFKLTDGLTFEDVEKEFFKQLNKAEFIVCIEKMEPKDDEESIYKSWKFRGILGRPFEWARKLTDWRI